MKEDGRGGREGKRGGRWGRKVGEGGEERWGLEGHNSLKVFFFVYCNILLPQILKGKKCCAQDAYMYSKQRLSKICHELLIAIAQFVV